MLCVVVLSMASNAQISRERNLEGRCVSTTEVATSGYAEAESLSPDGRKIEKWAYKWYSGTAKANDKQTAVEMAQREAYATISRTINNAVIDAGERVAAGCNGNVRKALAGSPQSNSGEGNIVTPSQSSSNSSQQNQIKEVQVNGVSFKMIYVAGGSFMMGATQEQTNYENNETPVHQVTLSDYYIAETEVTQELWCAVMGSNPSRFTRSSRNPVEMVSWHDCQSFIQRLNQLTGLRFRLPTEAEWEYAARGGNKSKGYKYSGSNRIDDVAWYDGNSGGVTHEVAKCYPNELGLYDMSGNVWEWCSDWFGSYSSVAQVDPSGAGTGSFRMNRGGGWLSRAQDCRVSYRYSNTPDFRDYDLGLRLVCSRL